MATLWCKINQNILKNQNKIKKLFVSKSKVLMPEINNKSLKNVACLNFLATTV